MNLFTTNGVWIKVLDKLKMTENKVLLNPGQNLFK